MHCTPLSTGAQHVVAVVDGEDDIVLATMVTFQYESGFDEAHVRQVAESARGRFEGLPGLRSKAFTVDPEQKVAVNFYLWESEDTGRAFFSPSLMERITNLYGVRPTIQYLRVAVLVDNAESP